MCLQNAWSRCCDYQNAARVQTKRCCAFCIQCVALLRIQKQCVISPWRRYICIVAMDPPDNGWRMTRQQMNYFLLYFMLSHSCLGAKKTFPKNVENSVRQRFFDKAKSGNSKLPASRDHQTTHRTYIVFMAVSTFATV